MSWPAFTFPRTSNSSVLTQVFVHWWIHKANMLTISVIELNQWLGQWPTFHEHEQPQSSSACQSALLLLTSSGNIQLHFWIPIKQSYILSSQKKREVSWGKNALRCVRGWDNYRVFVWDCQCYLKVKFIFVSYLQIQSIKNPHKHFHMEGENNQLLWHELAEQSTSFFNSSS